MKIKRLGLGYLLIILFFTALPAVVKAQDLPCLDGDPYGTCPLDSWVIAVVVIAGIFTAIHLHKKQRSAQV